MTMDIAQALDITASGLDAQSTRLRVIAENLANQNTTGSTPGAEAYRRKTVTFASELRGSGGVKVNRIGREKGDQQPLRYDPGSAAADANGYVKLPNVNNLVEIMDMRDAQRSYDANLAVMQATRSMLNRTIEMLK
jgi:flagellar basal-body rod protein FlgC